MIVKLGAVGLTLQWHKICSSYPDGAYLICVLENLTTVARRLQARERSILVAHISKRGKTSEHL